MHVCVVVGDGGGARGAEVEAGLQRKVPRVGTGTAARLSLPPCLHPRSRPSPMRGMRRPHAHDAAELTRKKVAPT